MKQFYLCLSLLLLLLCSTLKAQPPGYVPLYGLAGWWSFSGNALDSSSNHNDGIVSGATLSEDRFGTPASAYEFDGINDYIDLGAAGLGPNPDTFSVSIWFKVDKLYPDGQSGYIHACLMSKRQVTEASWMSISIDEDSFAGPELDAPDYNYMINGSMHVLDGHWHHIVAVKKGKTYTCYQDGIFAAYAYDSYSITGSGTEPMYIGHSAAWKSFLEGKVDDVGVWNRALTVTEVTDLYERRMRKLAVEAAARTPALSVFPNPARDEITITGAYSGQPVPYRITDLCGRTLLTGQLQNTRENISLSALSPGNYLLLLDNTIVQLSRQ